MKRSLLVFFTLAILASCKKDVTPVDNTVARDNSNAESLFTDILKVLHDVAEGTEGIREYEIGCINEVIVDLESTPMTVMVDFGTDECIGMDGRVRNGKLHMTFTGQYRDEGTVITVTPENYKVNGFLIEGVKTITNMGLNGNDQPYFIVSVNGSVIAPGNAYTLDLTAQRTRTWVEGFETIQVWDDIYEITGSGSGTNRFGTPYTTQILTPLRVTLSCPWIISGSSKIVPEGIAERVINFGSGDCNAGFTVTVDGTEFEIGGGN